MSPRPTTPWSRRTFLAGGAALVTLPAAAAAANDLEGEVGITCATLGAHMRPRNPSGFSLVELPRIARDELGMRVLDLATSNLPSEDPALLDRVREAAEEAGAILTNLKMNQPGLDLGSPEPEAREKAVAVYSKSIDAAARLGMRWVRPLPTKHAPEDREAFLDNLRRLADHAAERDLAMLVENFGWMQSDPNSIADLIAAIGRDLPACPDTGNWDSEEIRHAGLARSFPLAATCDFKVRTLGPDHEHAAWDLERCFRIGAEAGFRGPWCIEHGHADRETLFGELRWIRDRIVAWQG